MTLEEFNQLLDQNNHYTFELEHTVRFLKDNHVMVIERKDRNLLETLNDMRHKQIYPLVDKKFRLVFGVGWSNHLMLKMSLFRYHNAAGKGENVSHIGPYESADEYVKRGMGYYFSSMNKNMIVAGINYREDSYDKDVFLSFEVDRVI